MADLFSWAGVSPSQKEEEEKYRNEFELFKDYPELKEFKDQLSPNFFFSSGWLKGKERISKEEVILFFCKEVFRVRFKVRFEDGRETFIRVEVSSSKTTFDGALTINREDFASLLFSYPKEELAVAELHYLVELCLAKLLEEKYEKIFLAISMLKPVSVLQTEKEEGKGKEGKRKKEKRS